MGICERYVLKKLACLGSMLWDKTTSGPMFRGGAGKRMVKKGYGVHT